MSKNIDWSSLGFGYVQTDKRFVSNYKNGAWDDGVLTEDATVNLSECAGVPVSYTHLTLPTKA